MAYPLRFLLDDAGNMSDGLLATGQISMKEIREKRGTPEEIKHPFMETCAAFGGVFCAFFEAYRFSISRRFEGYTR